jgi:peptidoglycan/xylan/chitin deacetylase (PgdA/CDA1 family)
MRLCAVSVDLDEIPCYAAIHGLPEPEGEARHAIYRRALPRFEHLFDELGIPATFFVIGNDMSDATAADAVKRLSGSGHEIGNHTQDHLYDLVKRDAPQIREQIVRCNDALTRVTGKRPAGFRAPGYTITDTVFDVLTSLDMTYDSSVFPCPAYYTAKAATITSYKLRKRPTHSVIDDVRVLTAPAEPYRVGRPYHERGRGMLELPIGVTGDWSARLPYIGTSLVLAGKRTALTLTRLITGRSLVNLELHGIDLADADEDGLAELREHQPDLRKSRAEKAETLHAVIEALHDKGYQFVTLAEAAHVFASIDH